MILHNYQPSVVCSCVLVCIFMLFLCLCTFGISCFDVNILGWPNLSGTRPKAGNQKCVFWWDAEYSCFTFLMKCASLWEIVFFDKLNFTAALEDMSAHCLIDSLMPFRLHSDWIKWSCKNSGFLIHLNEARPFWLQWAELQWLQWRKLNPTQLLKKFSLRHAEAANQVKGLHSSYRPPPWDWGRDSLHSLISQKRQCALGVRFNNWFGAVWTTLHMSAVNGRRSSGCRPETKHCGIPLLFEIAVMFFGWDPGILWFLHFRTILVLLSAMFSHVWLLVLGLLLLLGCENSR